MKLVYQGKMHARGDADSGMKHILETIYRTVRYAVVNSGADQACDEGDGSVSGQQTVN